MFERIFEELAESGLGELVPIARVEYGDVRAHCNERKWPEAGLAERVCFAAAVRCLAIRMVMVCCIDAEM